MFKATQKNGRNEKICVYLNLCTLYLQGSHSCKTLYLNCMTLKDSATVFGKLYTDLTGKNAPTAKERLRAFEKSLTSDGPSM